MRPSADWLKSKLLLGLVSHFERLLEIQKLLHDSFDWFQIGFNCLLCLFKLAHDQLTKSLVEIKATISTSESKDISFNPFFAQLFTGLHRAAFPANAHLLVHLPLI